MKKVLFICAVLFWGCTPAVAQKLKEIRTVIQGYVPNLKDTTVTVEITIYLPEDQVNNLIYIKQQSEKGHFRFEFELQRMAQISVKVNQTILFYIPMIVIPVEPGDSLNIQVPDFKKTKLWDIPVTGRGSNKIDLMKKVYERFLEINVENKIPLMNISPNAYHELINKITISTDSIFKVNENLVDSKILKILKSDFYARNYDPLFLKLSRAPISEENGALFKKYISELALEKQFADPEAVLTNGASHTMYNLALLEYSYRTGDNAMDTKYRNPEKFFRIVSEFYKPYPFFREFLLSEHLIQLVRRNGTIPASVDTLISSFLSEKPVHNEFKENLKTLFNDAKNNIEVGQPAYNFSLTNSAGKIVKLSDFKGTVVVVDYFYTGCMACKAMVPFLQQVEHEFKGKDVVFVSISIDRSKELWKEGRGKFSSPSSIQLYTDGLGQHHPVIKYNLITSYPRLFVIDKKGNLVTARAPDPRSNKDGLSKLIYETIYQ